MNFADFRRKCAEERISGVYFEGGPQLVSQMLRDRQIDYLFIYRAPMLLADGKARDMFDGLRTERLTDAVRIRDVQHGRHGDDMLTRGRVVYPERMSVDETVFSLR